jgi:hypothetical protein
MASNESCASRPFFFWAFFFLEILPLRSGQFCFLPGTRQAYLTLAGSEGGWLGGRDSNPDTVVQSHVSYRWTTSHRERALIIEEEPGSVKPITASS